MAAHHSFKTGTSPIVFAAIHDGHEIRDELEGLFNLTEAERRREEDPYTSKWVEGSDNGIVVHHSRFEADVNRPRDKAVYRRPDDAWGLQVWKSPLPAEVLNRSLEVYDGFYRACGSFFDALFRQHQNIIVYDIHSYNHRRESAQQEADPAENPEVNIGTQHMDRERWHPVVESLMQHFRSFDYSGRRLDTRENIKFKGGYFGKWLYSRYGKNICPVSIEFKKFFMDEHTGEGYENDLELIGRTLRSSRQPVLEALKSL